jgi:hypothetical protein
MQAKKMIFLKTKLHKIMKEKLLDQLNVVPKKMLYIILLQLFIWQFAYGNDLNLQQSSSMFRQQPAGQITGKVTDETGSPLPGVSVIIKGWRFRSDHASLFG